MISKQYPFQQEMFNNLLKFEGKITVSSGMSKSAVIQKDRIEKIKRQNKIRKLKLEKLKTVI